jgi:type II secretory pathway pseudopilin PulG
MIAFPAGQRAPAHRRSGITLTEILIAIMILGVGLVSLATLFPIGLLRLRDATRYTRSALLLQSAASDATARGLLNKQSFVLADFLNYNVNNLTPPYWFPSALNPDGSGRYDPFTHDTAFYGADPYDANTPGAHPLDPGSPGITSAAQPGLPIAYDPLWRQVTGLYPDPLNALGQNIPEARFASGIGFIRNDPDGGLPSAHGLQRLTNFNRPAVMPVAGSVLSIFVSPEDTVWVEPRASNLISPVVPDLSMSSQQIPVGAAIVQNPRTTNDWRYSWMFTGQQSSAGNASTFDGNIVIFENRTFGYAAVTGPNGAGQQVAGETVVEAVFGYSNNISIVNPPYAYGYATGADHIVLLRWPTSVPDPVVRPGDWIADVTYERSQNVVYNPATQTGRFFVNVQNVVTGYPNFTNQLEWDNLPAQRCFWYQVQKVSQVTDPYDATYRAIVVYVNQSLQARTLLQANGQPQVVNAALIAPNVVNVIPQTIFAR